MVLVLRVHQPGPATVQLLFRAQDWGPLEGAVAIGTDRVSFTQWVLP